MLDIRFEHVARNGEFDIYMRAYDGDRLVRETPCGHCDTLELAVEACKRTNRAFNAPKPKPVHKPHNRMQIDIIPLRGIQQMACCLDPERMMEMFEQLMMVNFCIHWLSDAFDRLTTVFDRFVDKSTMTHYDIASKHIDKLLDALYKSSFSGQGDREYTSVVSDALRWKAIFEILVSHVKPNDKDWRYVQLRKVFNDIMPSDALAKERREFYDQLSADMSAGNTIIEKGGAA